MAELSVSQGDGICIRLEVSFHPNTEPSTLADTRTTGDQAVQL